MHAGTRGFLDKLAITDIDEFQVGLVSHVKSSAPEILAELTAKGAIDDALDAKMKSVVGGFTESFMA